ncbi:MAG TPA: hypothetical protein DDZ38_11010 [Gammaproteobacteria bacterium]|nr:hypothetical protein [Gammaproteobacteria bacterium]
MAKSDWSIYRRLLSYVGRYWFALIISIIGFLLAAAAEGYFARLFGNLIDEWDDVQMRAAASIPMLMALATLLRAVGSIAGESAMARASFGVVYNLREELFSQILNSTSSYFDREAQGHVVSRVTFTVSQLRDTGTDALKSIIQDGVKVLAFLGYMLYLNWQLTLLFIAMAPLLALVVVFASSRFRRISRRIQRSMGDVTHVVSETVAGYRVVKIFGGKDREEQRFDRASKTNRQQNMKMAVTKALSSQTNETIIALGLCGLILLLYRPDLGITMTSGDAVAFLVLAGMLGRPIKKLSEVNAKLQRGFAAAEDIFTQLDFGIEANQGTIRQEAVRGALELKNVTFRYEAHAPLALDDVSLTIRAGETIALVGRSGSGKSTLASLLPRFYDVDIGSIELDGVNIQGYELHNLRQHIAFVSQQVTLFNDSLRNNIAYGDMADASNEMILNALKRSHANEFIDRLPDGLETLVGDDGVLLSGGQRQRIAIARALLKDAPILILDEATSALDNESEKHIQAALEEVMVGRTTVVIAHRLSTVEAADRIVVLDQGKVVEEGVHAELLSASGLYADLYAAQFRDEPDAVSMPRPKPLARPQQLVRSNSVLRQSASALSRAWYSQSSWPRLLSPLSWLYGLAIRWRRGRLTPQGSADERLTIPVIVVGNITVGGTGKTPLVGWLVNFLQQRGFRPGVVSRGYRGRLSTQGALLPPNPDPTLHSDEATLLKTTLKCPVAIAAKRNKAIALLQRGGCDIAISDDGLQHHQMRRNIEIAVVDGSRGFGNGLLLPAGPLREPVSRLQEVDFVICNEKRLDALPQAYGMQSRLVAFKNLLDGRTLSAEEFIEQFVWANALCGIGNPQRFLDTLSQAGLNITPYIFEDHHIYSAEDAGLPGGGVVVCTEKDAIKLANLDIDLGRIWSTQVEIVMSDAFGDDMLGSLEDHAIRPARTLISDQEGER